MGCFYFKSKMPKVEVYNSIKGLRGRWRSEKPLFGGCPRGLRETIGRIPVLKIVLRAIPNPLPLHRQWGYTQVLNGEGNREVAIKTVEEERIIQIDPLNEPVRKPGRTILGDLEESR